MPTQTRCLPRHAPIHTPLPPSNPATLTRSNPAPLAPHHPRLQVRQLAALLSEEGLSDVSYMRASTSVRTLVDVAPPHLAPILVSPGLPLFACTSRLGTSYLPALHAMHFGRADAKLGGRTHEATHRFSRVRSGAAAISRGCDG